MQNKTTVIYIISDRRSGSTLLENILFKSDEIVSVGELAMLKGHILKEGPGELWNWNCSCGKPIMQCEFWSKVLAEIYTDSFETKIEWRYKSLKILFTAVAPAIFKNFFWQFIYTKKNKQTIAQLNAVYTSIATASNKKFIVDASKDPLQALAITECKNVDVKFIWLSRDLRAITFSKLKRWKINKRSDKKPLETLVVSFYYKKICAAALKCIDKKNLIKINYNELAANPQKELNKICEKFGLEKYYAPQFMELFNDHTIAGTPDRFERKAIAADRSWENFFKQRKTLNILGEIFNSL